MRKLLSFFLLAISTAAIASNTFTYRPIRGLSVVKSVEFTFESDGYFSNVESYVETGTFVSESLLKDNIVKGTNEVFSFLKEKDITYVQCRPKPSLEIFITKKITLNDKNRFPQFKDKKIVGLYDPVVEEPFFAAIVVSEQDSYSFSETVIHEVAHYWYDRLCLDRYSKYGTEQFAQIIEKR